MSEQPTTPQTPENDANPYFGLFWKAFGQSRGNGEALAQFFLEKGMIRDLPKIISEPLAQNALQQVYEKFHTEGTQLEQTRPHLELQQLGAFSIAFGLLDLQKKSLQDAGLSLSEIKKIAAAILVNAGIDPGDLNK